MNFNLVPNLDSTTTLQSMADQCKLYTKLQSFLNVGGIDSQPFLRIATNVQEMLLSRRMGWKFNRVQMGGNNPAENPAFFMTQQGTQDVLHAGATCFSLINSTTPGGQLPAGGAGVDLNPGVYQNGNARVVYGTFNGGNSLGSQYLWQTAGIVFNPANGTFIVQFLQAHPFLAGSIGTTPILIAGVVNPAFNSIFVWNGLTQFSNYTNSFTLLDIPDIFHIVLQGTPRQYGQISHISATGGTTTVTVPNQMLPGSLMTFTGITTNTALNGKTVQILTGAPAIMAGDLSGTIQMAATVTFATPTGVTITNGADTGTIYAANSGAPGIFNFGWAEQANMIDINNPSYPLPTTPIDAVLRIVPEYTSTGDQMSVACDKDFGNGVLKFRLSEPVSTYPFAFGVVYQARAPKFINGQSVFQWPDYLSWVLFEMIIWQGMRFAYGMTAQETEMQMRVAMGAVQSALEAEDRESSELGLVPNWPIMR